MQSRDRELQCINRLCLTTARPCMWLGVRLGNRLGWSVSMGRWKECARCQSQGSNSRKEQRIVHRDCKRPCMSSACNEIPVARCRTAMTQ